MNIVGIICEYNPFHMGHQYQMEQIRRIFGQETAIICAMSGNFTQRGEPAIFEKHSRAEAAIACGADLVVENPWHRASASAEWFASGGIETLAGLGICSHLAFGSESGDTAVLERVAKCLGEPETNEIIKAELASGKSYPKARQSAVYKCIGAASEILTRPNDILAVEYIKAVYKLNVPLKTIAIQRHGEGHDRDACSGKRIRECFSNQKEPWRFIPESAEKIFRREIDLGRGPVLLRNLESPMLSALRKCDNFSEIPDASEGLDRRLAKYANEATLDNVIAKVKTKRYTRSRISRMALCAYLGITQADVEKPVSYITVLGMSQRGRELLKKARQHGKLPIITKPATAKKMTEEIKKQFERQALITDLYTLAFPNPFQRNGGMEWKSGPFILKEETEP